jgi:hypothetical protein
MKKEVLGASVPNSRVEGNKKKAVVVIWNLRFSEFFFVEGT